MLSLAIIALGSVPTTNAQITSAGAKTGWVYYGGLGRHDIGFPEKWFDLNFNILQSTSTSKVPQKGMKLTCNTNMSLRASPLDTSTGNIQWPAVTGVLITGATVTVLDVRIYSAQQGTHYWIEIQR